MQACLCAVVQVFETLFAYAYASTSRRHDHEGISGEKGGYVLRMIHATKRVYSRKQTRSSPEIKETNACRTRLHYRIISNIGAPPK